MLTGVTWCLDFQHAVRGSTSGQLNVYKVLNGVKGSALYTKVGASSKTISWERTQLTIEGTELADTDMVEVCSECFKAFEYG